MVLLIGIDDTDNRISRGTGFLSRKLAKNLELNGLGSVLAISRHQLLVHPQIAYTSQNSSACLMINTEYRDDVMLLTKNFITEFSASGSDAGLCAGNWDDIDKEIVDWGYDAKRKVLDLKSAIGLAKEKNIYLEGLSGKKIGQIGAMAALGLRKGGNDGRLIWLKKTGELRDFDHGIYTPNRLKSETGIDYVHSMEGDKPDEDEPIFCSGWTRPVIMDNKAILLVEKTNFADYGWKTVPKDIIRKRY